MGHFVSFAVLARGTKVTALSMPPRPNSPMVGYSSSAAEDEGEDHHEEAVTDETTDYFFDLQNECLASMF